MALAHPALPQEARESIACDYYIDALDDDEFGLKVRERAPASLDEALRVSLQLEAWLKGARQKLDDSARMTQKACGSVQPAASSDSSSSHLDDRFSRLEANINKRVDEFLDRAQKSRQSASCSTPTVCWRCGLPGHLQRNYTQPITAPSNKKVSRGSHAADRDDVYISMRLVDKDIPCLVDSGCEITLVPKSVVDRVEGVTVQPSNRQVWAANGTDIVITGEVALPFELEGRRVETFALRHSPLTSG